MSDERFNPRQHLRIIPRRQKLPDGTYQTVNNEYLDVRWRIVWFREEQPDGSIVTTLLSNPAADLAVVQAVVNFGEVSTTGLGRVTKDDWPRFLEKAETAAIGRALALAGYGTQFCDDFDEEDGELADSPQEKRVYSDGRVNNPPPPQSGTGITPPQKRLIFAVADKLNIATPDLKDIVFARFGKTGDELTKQEASEFITDLKQWEAEGQVPADVIVPF